MSLRDFRMTILLSDKHCSFALVLAPPFHSALIIYNSSNDAMPMPPSVRRLRSKLPPPLHLSSPPPSLLQTARFDHDDPKTRRGGGRQSGVGLSSRSLLLLGADEYRSGSNDGGGVALRAQYTPSMQRVILSVLVPSYIADGIFFG